MRSTIEKYTFLKEWAKKFPGILEIYASTKFDIEMDYPEFTILCKEDFQSVEPFEALQKFYEGKAKLYIAHDPLSLLFKDKRIIFYEGRWYI